MIGAFDYGALGDVFERLFAIIAELFLGVILLLGTVWLATHLAVRIFGVKPSSTPGGPLA